MEFSLALDPRLIGVCLGTILSIAVIAAYRKPIKESFLNLCGFLFYRLRESWRNLVVLTSLALICQCVNMTVFNEMINPATIVIMVSFFVPCLMTFFLDDI